MTFHFLVLYCKPSLFTSILGGRSKGFDTSSFLFEFHMDDEQILLFSFSLYIYTFSFSPASFRKIGGKVSAKRFVQIKPPMVMMIDSGQISSRPRLSFGPPKSSWGRDISLFQGNPGWWNVIPFGQIDFCRDLKQFIFFFTAALEFGWFTSYLKNLNLATKRARGCWHGICRGWTFPSHLCGDDW